MTEFCTDSYSDGPTCSDVCLPMPGGFQCACSDVTSTLLPDDVTCRASSHLQSNYEQLYCVDIADDKQVAELLL